MTTDAKDPKLTTFDILTMKDGKPQRLARTRTAFYRWEDYQAAEKPPKRDGFKEREKGVPRNT